MFSLNLQEKGEKNMLENLKKEMDRQGVKVKDIANLLGLKSPAISKRIYGTVQLQESEKVSFYLEIQVILLQRKNIVKQLFPNALVCC